MCDEQRIEIEREEIVRVSIPIPKRFVEFIKEFGEWSGYEDVDEYIKEYIIESIEAMIWSDLDRVRGFAPLKYEYFYQKFNLR